MAVHLHRVVINACSYDELLELPGTRRSTAPCIISMRYSGANISREVLCSIPEDNHVHQMIPSIQVPQLQHQQGINKVQ